MVFYSLSFHVCLHEDMGLVAQVFRHLSIECATSTHAHTCACGHACTGVPAHKDVQQKTYRLKAAYKPRYQARPNRHLIKNPITPTTHLVTPKSGFVKTPLESQGSSRSRAKAASLSPKGLAAGGLNLGPCIPAFDMVFGGLGFGFRAKFILRITMKQTRRFRFGVSSAAFLLLRHA